MLNIDSEKMSKSLGNFVTARDFLSEYGGEVTRYLMMSAHYRTVSDFGGEAIESALTNLHRLYEAKSKAESLSRKRGAVADARAETVWAEFLAESQKARTEMAREMANDFNTPGALAAIFSLIRAYNRTLAEPRSEATPSAALGSSELVRVIEDELGGFLGLGRRPAEAMLDRIGEIRSKLHSGEAIGKAEIEKLIADRAEAKRSKNFSEADRIRKELSDRGVAIKDSPTGTTWEYKA
jgi:cysteinyl-tRNA synthetase